MRTSNPCINAAVRLLAEVGIHDVQVAHGSKHPQLRFRINNANVLHVFSVCGTPSDWRSPENTRRDLRKYLRAAGVVVDEPTREPSQPPPKKLDRVGELEREVLKLKSTLVELEQRLTFLEDRGVTDFTSTQGVVDHDI